MSRILKFFVTSLMIAVSKKLVFYIEGLISFNTSESAIEYIQCVNCNNKYRIEILRKMKCLDMCPNCLVPFPAYKENQNYESRRFNNWSSSTSN